jgi:hypothetical protein
MAYTLNFSIALGSCNTGLTLNARLVDNTGTDYGAAITTGFNEIDDGYYLWHYESFPDDFRGGVKFYEQGAPGTILAFLAINPEEAEDIADVLAAIDDNTIISVNDLKRIIFG